MQWPEGVLEVIEKLESAGYEAYAVGGCVRDALLGRDPSDWDVCTDARPAEMQAVFTGEHVIETGLKHGTLTVRSHGLSVEVTTFRTDGAYTDHRRPDAVRFVTSLSDDLARRDFTVNAMALTPGGNVIDLFGGQQDLTDKVIRCVGVPEARFDEDALRILRALRFASQLDFAIEDATARAILLMRDDLKHVSVERVYAELKRLITGPGAGRVLSRFGDVLGTMLLHYRVDPVALDKAPRDAELRLAILLHGGDARDALHRLRADNKAIERVVQLCALCALEPPRDETSALKFLYVAGDPSLARDALSILRAQGQDVAQALAALDAVLNKNACYRLRDLAVNGDDLLSLGIGQGHALGQALNMLLERVIAGELTNDRSALLQAAGASVSEPRTRSSADKLSGSTK